MSDSKKSSTFAQLSTGVMMRFSTANAWLEGIATIHPKQIDLGLDRVKQVAAQLDLLKAPCTTILVAGTNGKGSTVAGLDAIYRAAGYRVGTYTSPYLFEPTEMIHINGQMISEKAFCDAFSAVDAARGDVTLTPFEFQTLAALWALKREPLDGWILEIGLGGRLDAVNIIDPDVSVITTIALDHMDYLGDTRDAIALEKAGICREGVPLVCGDIDPPVSLMNYVKQHHIPYYGQKTHFDYQQHENDWSWVNEKQRYDHLPLTRLALQNMSTVMMTVTLLQERLPVTAEALSMGLKNVSLSGRIQIIEGQPMQILDVSHNPASVALLVSHLKTMPCAGKTRAVFSMLKDKAIAESIALIAPLIDHWYIAPLQTPRSTTSEQLQFLFAELNITRVSSYTSIKEAHAAALHNADQEDRIIIFGSFHTIAEATLNARAIIST